MTRVAPQDIEGTFPAALTFVGPDLVPDAGACLTHCRWLLENGADGIALLGTTGEAPSFSVAERRALLDALLEGGVPAERIIAGTGAAALSDAVELTAHAARAGVAACLVIPPFYFKEVPDDGLFASYAALIERLRGTDFNLFLYHFPQMSAVPIPHPVIARLIESFPGTVAGLKDSSGDLENMLALVERFPGLRVFSGTERYLLPVLEAGGAGCITAGGNITSSEIGRLYRHWRDHGGGPEAEALQRRVTELRGLLEGAPMIAAMKALLARHRDAPGLARAMPPQSPLGEAEAEAFGARLAAAGFTLP